MIDNPESYENETLFNQTIYVKVLTNNQCFRSAQIELKIGASAIDESFLLKFSTCETSPSIEQDGIETWSSSEIFGEITNQLIASDSKFSGQNITILYFNNKEDALTKNNAIDINSTYTNITPFVQDIWVSVEINELNVLKGSLNILSNNQCYLQIEIFPHLQDEILSFLDNNQFKLLHRINNDFYLKNFF